MAWNTNFTTASWPAFATNSVASKELLRICLAFLLRPTFWVSRNSFRSGTRHRLLTSLRILMSRYFQRERLLLRIVQAEYLERIQIPLTTPKPMSAYSTLILPRIRPFSFFLDPGGDCTLRVDKNLLTLGSFLHLAHASLDAADLIKHLPRPSQRGRQGSCRMLHRAPRRRRRGQFLWLARSHEIAVPSKLGRPPQRFWRKTRPRPSAAK